jgi:hypothetical protein
MSTESTEAESRRDLNGAIDLTVTPALAIPRQETPAGTKPPGGRHRQGESPARARASNPMDAAPRRGIGFGLFVLSALAIAHLLWAWAFTAKLVSAGPKTPPLRVHWFTFAFTPSVEWSLLLVVTLAAAAGSTAHSALVFSNRAGHDTLESTWAFWYLLRPGAAAIIGVLSYVIVKAGFLGAVNNGDDKGLAFAAAVGALAGLFTDTLMAKLRQALGASPFKAPTSAQATTDDPAAEAEQQPA